MGPERSSNQNLLIEKGENCVYVDKLTEIKDGSRSNFCSPITDFIPVYFKDL